ncbi:AAA family ATPase [Bradyrhizobium sp. SZCCHNPS2010]|uniref:AAA family ATPase n=1 Tax=Bradyrhizobium sp. SZCCHNPS2010 TaxID=3057333 RepID=UPI00291601DD|nr:AAA family ATPase [Bradyrhizobium sp. SZCCHNPS2010]
MDFFVAEKSRREGPPRLGQLVLQQDAWDDFGFKTQYHVFYFGPEFDGFVGNVKILRRGQKETLESLLPVGRGAPLDDQFCSLGQSLDYYERLASLPENVRKDILETLRDALHDPAHAATFQSEPGWSTSVKRDVDDDGYVALARVLLERDYEALASRDVKLKFTVSGWQNSLDLDFSGPQGPPIRPQISFSTAPTPRLPERVAVITGRNGSGKSTLLFRLARVLHASQADRRQLTKLGSIEPAGIGFSRIITIAYSAFDTFQVPGVNETEKRQIIKDVQSKAGRYVFAGLRDIASELNESIAGPSVSAPEPDDDGFALDREEFTHLKSAKHLAEEYATAIDLIFERNRTRILIRVLKLLFSDPSFAEISGKSAVDFLREDQRRAFMSWSTGHKIVLHATVTLIANALPKSIVLMDEPESHLHPPLLAAFMHGVRAVLDEYDSFAVIATHSPVVVQETLRRHVSIVNRIEGGTAILPPRIETYGESIGEITNEVFGLHANATDYHTTLRGMVEEGLTLEEIDSHFDGGMSLQARAYVMSLLAKLRA